MKILISGANGVVGSDLVKFFSKKIKFMHYSELQIQSIKI